MENLVWLMPVRRWLSVCDEWWAGPDLNRRPLARKANVLTKLDDRPSCFWILEAFSSSFRSMVTLELLLFWSGCSSILPAKVIPAFSKNGLYFAIAATHSTILAFTKGRVCLIKFLCQSDSPELWVNDNSAYSQNIAGDFLYDNLLCDLRLAKKKMY